MVISGLVRVLFVVFLNVGSPMLTAWAAHVDSLAITWAAHVNSNLKRLKLRQSQFVVRLCGDGAK